MTPIHVRSTRQALKTASVSRVQDCLAKKCHPLNARWTSPYPANVPGCPYYSGSNVFSGILMLQKIPTSLHVSEKNTITRGFRKKHSYKISKPNMRSGVFFLSRRPLGYQTKGKKDLLIVGLTKSPMHPCKNHCLAH